MTTVAPVHEDLLSRRSDYPILARKTYLASHTLGAMHAGTPGRLAHFAELWATDGVVAWEQWQPEIRRVGDLVGSLIGAPAGTTVMRQNVADLLGDVISCLDWRGPRNRVVTSSLEWPGSLNTWSQIERLGGEAVVVPGAGIELDLEAMLAAIDERTQVVECSHVLFRTATLNDVKPLIDRAHEVGALAVIDGYQAAGTVPVDVVALGADIYLGGSVKYLSGGPGNGWMYLRPGLDLEPVTTGWFGQARPFDFDPDNHYADGVTRFAGGTPGVPAHYAAAPAYEALASIGMQRIRERSVSMTQPLVESALERGFAVRSPVDPSRRGGHVTIDPGRTPGDSQRIHDALHAQGFVVDHRPGVGIRVSLHFYNSLDEGLACLDAMQAAAG